VKLLLDTHCWLWMQAEPERLGAEVLDILADEDNDLLLSAASAWEIAIKYALGKLPLPEPPDLYVPDRMATSGVVPLPVSHAAALRVAVLPPLHRDPFDRLLIAQAQLEKATVLTADRAFALYDVPVRWAA
jgi:PIN domain nuclease of toxin-antitoxin system